MNHIVLVVLCTGVVLGNRVDLCRLQMRSVYCHERLCIFGITVYVGCVVALCWEICIDLCGWQLGVEDGSWAK